MTPKERAFAAFQKQPTDLVPIYQAGLSSRVASLVLGREAYTGGGIQQYREACALWAGEEAHAEFVARSQRDAFEVIEKLDLDVVRPSYWRMAIKPTERIDEHTFLYGDREASRQVMRFSPETELYQVVDFGPKITPSLEDLEASVTAQEASVGDYDPKPEHFPDLLAAKEYFGERRLINGAGIGICVPRERVWLEAIALRPDLVGRLLMVQAERAAKIPPVMAKLGLPCIMGGGDFAGENGPFYSPKAFHELMLPALQRVSEACHEHGCYHGFASDGDLWPVAEDLFGASGVDFFYEVDGRAGMTIPRLRQTFPQLSLMGNIASYTLHRGTKHQVIAETRQAMEEAVRWGGVIVGCSNQVVAQTPPENFWAMVETMHHFRRR